MTLGEKIAWVWVWSALTALLASAAFIAWRYWDLPFAYLDDRICASYNDAVAAPACARVIANPQAPADLRAPALRRLSAIAKTKGKHDDAIRHLSAIIATQTPTAEDWNERALSYYARRDYQKAADDFQMAAFTKSEEGIYWSNIGDAQVELKKYSEAIQSYTTAMRKGNDTAEVRGNRGWARYQLDAYKNALADYDKAIATDKSHGDNFNERGLVRHALGDYEGALGDYAEALKLKTDEPVILTNRAVTLLRLDEKERARQDLDRAIGLDANYATARLEKAWMLINESRPEGAIVELQALERAGSLDIWALEARSRARADLGDWQGTIADAEKALAITDKYTWPYEYRARARRGLGDYSGAAADATTLLRRSPKKMDLLASRAVSLQLAGRTDAALADMDQAIRDNDEPAYAYEIRALLHLNAGRLTDALRDARQSVALAGYSSHSATMLGWVLIENGDPAGAVKECSRSLTIRTSMPAYACRAFAEIALERPNAADADINQALGIDRLSGLPYLAWGRLDLAQGNPRKAAEHLSRALDFETWRRSEILLYRGDAQRALGNIAAARADYQQALKFDAGLRRLMIDQRLADLPAP